LAESRTNINFKRPTSFVDSTYSDEDNVSSNLISFRRGEENVSISKKPLFKCVHIILRRFAQTWIAVERGLALPTEFLNELCTVPKNLNYIRWDVGDSVMLHQLKRMASRRMAARWDGPRVIPV
jgi:hypothetical protein